MESSAGKALLLILTIGCLLTGCQSSPEMSSNALRDSPRSSPAKSAVVDELGPVAVLKRDTPFVLISSKEAKQQVQQAGFQQRGAINEKTLRHASGTTAEILYFTELKDDGIGAGAVKIRNSGHSKALVKIDGTVVGECTIFEPVVGLSDITYARPVALADGEHVPIGSVKVGARQFSVISKCRYNGEQGAVSVFFNGRDRTIWNDYEIDGRVVAKRVCPPEDAVEFSPELSPEEQLSIAADMYFRLSEDRVTERQKNTVFVPVYY